MTRPLRKWVFLLWCVSFTALAEETSAPRVSIIIDDIGYNYQDGLRAINLPYPLTLAFIPHTPYGKKLASQAHLHKKEIMLHAPMESLDESKIEAGFNTGMDQLQIADMFHCMLSEIPHAKGVNNHGGSKFTQDVKRMQWFLHVIQTHDLYFIDSRTTADTSVASAAESQQIAFNSRDVFIDNDLNPMAIAEQLEKLRKIATKQGTAIGIGHAHPETLEVLEMWLPIFAQNGVEIVPASELVKIKDLDNYHRDTAKVRKIPPQSVQFHNNES